MSTPARRWKYDTWLLTRTPTVPNKQDIMHKKRLFEKNQYFIYQMFKNLKSIFIIVLIALFVKRIPREGDKLNL